MFEEEVIYAISKGNLFIDYKTELQEVLQKKGKPKIEYNVEKEVGPDHNKKILHECDCRKQNHRQWYG